MLVCGKLWQGAAKGKGFPCQLRIPGNMKKYGWWKVWRQFGAALPDRSTFVFLGLFEKLEQFMTPPPTHRSHGFVFVLEGGGVGSGGSTRLMPQQPSFGRRVSSRQASLPAAQRATLGPFEGCTAGGW